MPKKQNQAREDRIIMEVVVDAYDSVERAMGWYYYLEDKLSFAFTATCTKERSISPLQKGDEVEVTGMAPSYECQHEMFVMIRYERKKELAVSLAQLKPIAADDATKQAVEDWLYWVQMGYKF